MDSPVFDAMRTGVDDHTELAVAELLQRHGERIASARSLEFNNKSLNSPNVGHWFTLFTLFHFCGLRRTEGNGKNSFREATCNYTYLHAARYAGFFTRTCDT